jgi:hypothetical protein
MDGVMEGQRVQKDAPAEADGRWRRKEAGRNCFPLDRSQLDGNGKKRKQKFQRVIGGEKEIMVGLTLYLE